MSAVVADTHTLVWLLFAPEKLSVAAEQALQRAIQAGEPIYISAISLIELTYLVEKERLPHNVLEQIVAQCIDPNSGLALVPIDVAVAQALKQISRAIVPEMPDRIIASTALYLGLPLVTCDLKIRAADAVITIW